MLTVLAVGLMPVMPAHARSLGLVPSFPTIQKVGADPVTVLLWVVNTSTGTTRMTDLRFIPSCSNWDQVCAGGIADPGTFTVSPTGKGVASTGCANQTFNFTVADPATGQIQVRRTDNQDVVLAPLDISHDLDICKIEFTMKANRMPNHDSFPLLGGMQTNQNIQVSNIMEGLGTVFTGVTNDVTTIEPGPAPRYPARADFNGDGRSDIAVFRPGSGIWFVHGSEALAWGNHPSDIPVPADYDGDGKIDVAVYRKATGEWWLYGQHPVVWGGDPSDIPVPADYDGDGKAELAVYRRATGVWFIKGLPAAAWGMDPSDVPVPADYDGDGKLDLAVYRASTGTWWVQGKDPVVWGGDPSDVATPADFDGDGKAELTIYRRSTGVWFRYGMPAAAWGMDPSDIPAPADYDGDGKAELTVYRKATGTLWIIGRDPLVWVSPGDLPLTALSTSY